MRMAMLVLGLELLAGPGNALAQRPLGIDVSSYQGGSINWTSVKNSGVTFAWTKATEGTYYYDADFTINEGNAKGAGVYIGAYHFARPDLDVGTAGADTEAAFFWNHAKAYLTGGNGYLVPMLDFETSYGSGASMSAWINEWCQAVKNYAAANGAVCNPVVYTDGSIASSLTSPATNWPLDIADPGFSTSSAESGSPTVSLGAWGTWTFWQYSWTASVPGVSGGVDADVLNGSASTLQAFLITTSGTSAGPGVSLDWDPSKKNASPGSGGTGNWDNGTANWWLSGTGDVAWNAGGDYADFAGTAGTVTLTTGVSADGISFDTAGYVITGTSETLTLNSPGNINVAPGTPTYIECVLGGVGYNLSGGGVLVLNNAGNYSGSGTSAEFIIGPNTTLVVNSDHAVGSGGVTLNLEAGGIYQDNDTTSGDQFLLPGSAIALLSGGGVFDNPNASLTMTNYITGPGSLTIIGTTYTLTLTDTGNNYTGGTIVQSGTLKANAAGVMGSTSGPLTVSGGTLDLNGASHTAGAVTISGGTIQNGTLTGSSYAGQSGTVSAVLAGSGAMTQSTSGALTLTGVNTYSGGTTIGGGGFYQIAADSALGNASAPLTLNGGCLKNDNSTVTLNANRTVTLGTSGGYVDAGWAPANPVTINGKITGAGPLCINLDGSPVVLGNTGNNYTGDTIIGTNGPGYYSTGTAAWLQLGAANVLPNGSSAGNVVIFNAYHGRLDLNGHSDTINGLLGDGVVTNGSSTACTLTIGANNDATTFSGSIVNTTGNGALALTKTGTGQITLSGANTFTGITTINGGKLQINADTRLGAAPASPVANQVTLSNGGIGVGLRVNGNCTFSANRGIKVVGNGGSVEASSGVTANYPGVITGTGNFASGGGYTSGYGTNVFSGANNYSGTTTIAAGTLRLGANGTLPYGTPLTIAADNNTGAGGTLDLGGYSQTIGPLASSAGIGGAGTDTPTILLTGALTVLQTNLNTTFAGLIAGAGGSLTKAGSATLTLSGANTYTGPTTINAGTLEGGVSGSIPGNVTVNSGTLELDDPAAMASGATLTLASSPAAGAVNLNFSGTQTINALYFGTTRKAAGTWAASGATHNNAAFTGSGILNVTTGPASGTTVSLTSGSSPSTYGNSLTFTATVTGNSPGGTVQFQVDGVAVGSPVTLIGGSAPLVVSALSVAGSPHQVTAYYSGDDNNNPSDSSARPIAQAITAKSLTVILNGSVSKSYDGTTAATLATGNYSLLGVLGGDTVNLNNPTSGIYDTRNTGSSKLVSVTGLAISGPSSTNYTLSFISVSSFIGTISQTNLTVTAAPNSKPYDGTTSAAARPTVTAGSIQTGDGAPTWTETYDSKNVGTGKTLTPAGMVNDGNGGANYNVTFANSIGGVITALTTSCLLTSSVNPAASGTNLTFTAEVNGVPPAADLPTGNVVFSANGAPFATNALISGSITADTVSLPAGTNAMAAQYLGDGNFLGSTGSVAQVVNLSVTCSQTNALLSIADNLDGTFTLTFAGTPQAAYYVLASPDLATPMTSWAPVVGSTNTVTNVSGWWQFTVTNTAPQQFYRSTAAVPCP
jgi:autotransporter-associated beta strand protein